MAFPILLVMAAVQAFSSAKQAQEARDAADLQNDLNNINAKYLDQDAFNAETFGYTESASYQKVIDQTVSSQRAGYASQNVDVNYGTAAEIQDETKITGMLNILDIQTQARNRAAGIKQQAFNLRQGSSVQKNQAYADAQANETTGYLKAGATGYRGYTQLGPGKPDLLGKSNKTKMAGESYNDYGDIS